MLCFRNIINYQRSFCFDCNGIFLFRNNQNICIYIKQPLQNFDYSNLNCVGIFNCNLDQSIDNSITTNQNCESGKNISDSSGVLTNLCALSSDNG